MQATLRGSLLDRIIGVCRLDVATYDAIVRDSTAMPGALIVVVLAAISSGIAAMVDADEGIWVLFVGLAFAFIFWGIYALAAWYAGVELVRGRRLNATFAEVLRVLGFAQAPGILTALAAIPVAGVAIGFAIWAWTLVTGIVAIRQVFDTSIARAIVIAILGVVISLILVVIATSVLGIGSAFLL
jgi:hypothetical protein